MTTTCHTLTIAAAAEQIRTRQLSPVDLVRSCLQRIDQLDAHLQAWVTVDRERALAAAQHCEEEIQRGQYRGPLHGIPIGIKDIFYTKIILDKNGFGGYYSKALKDPRQNGSEDP